MHRAQTLLRQLLHSNPSTKQVRSFFSMGSTMKVISSEEALPGRSDEMNIVNKHFILGNPIKGPFPEGHETAIFATGCFWGTEKGFWRLPGVYSTATGYAGGHTPNPNYNEVCSQRTGHTEVVHVVYDQKVVSYADLLRLFWESHDPTQANGQGNDKGTQYRSAVYTNSPHQKALAEASKAAYLKALTESGKGMGSEIYTEFAEDQTMYYAEDSHQQYLAKPGNRQYCSAMPSTQKMPPFEQWNVAAEFAGFSPVLDEKFWDEHGPKPHCTIKGPNDQIKWP